MPVVFDEVVGTVANPPEATEAASSATGDTTPAITVGPIRQQTLHWLRRQRRLAAN